jgi:hypothetical protein
MPESNAQGKSDQAIYGTDAPVNDPTGDHFDRWPFARRIARSIAGRSDPSSIVIGIYGAWGAGKTTVLNFIQKELEQHADIVCVQFDPWRVGDEVQVLAGFFGAVAEALDQSVERRSERFAEAFKRYVSPLIPSVGPGLLGVDPSKAVDNVIDRYFSVDLDKQRVRIEAMLEESGKRVVVLMDDIDRLERSEIQTIFKLVKLTANFAYTAYVLAFDDAVVASALNERYGSGGGESGRAFLEKIVQVALHLPAATFEALNDYCLGGLAELLSRERVELTEEQVQRFREGFDRGLRSELRTPRDATRYANVLAFSLPLLHGEVDPIDLMLIEGTRIFYPTLYETIRDHRGSFLRRSNPRSGPFESDPPNADDIWARSVTEDQRGAAKHIVDVLFPRPQAGGTGGVVNQAIADPAYFDRYFTYAVTSRDVPDAAVLDLIRGLPSLTSGAVPERLRTLATADTGRLLVPKLWRFSDIGSSDDDLGKLAVGLSAAGELFPDRGSQFLATTPFGEAALLVQKLVSRIQDEGLRPRVAEHVALESEPVTFMAESFRRAAQAWKEVWGEDVSPATGANVHFPQYCQPAVRRAIRERIKAFMESLDDATEVSAPNLRNLLFVWKACEDEDGIDHYLRHAYSERPETLPNLLTRFMPFNPATGEPSDFLISDAYALMFDSVSTIVSPETVMAILRQMPDFERLRTEGRSSHRIAERAAWGFVFVYEHRTSQNLSEDVT